MCEQTVHTINKASSQRQAISKVFWGKSKVTRGFLTKGVSVPNPRDAQRSIVHFKKK